MGTPHSGSGLAKWAKIPVRLLGLVQRVDTNLLDILQTDSEVLDRIQDDFLTMLRDRAARQRPIAITCFFETLPLAANVM